VKHEVFVDTCDKYFLSIAEGIATTNATTSAPGLHGPAKPAYIGGEAFTRTHEGGIAHVALGLQAPAATAKEAYALGVLQSLLGGSEGNAAAGALRKGPQRQSRIARSLHNDAHSFIRSIGAFAFPYSDAGIVGISGSCADHEAGRLVDVFAGFLKDAASVAATSAELERAKKLYKVNLALARESRDGARDDIALQTLIAGKQVSLADAFKAIDAVTAADVQALAKSALASKPSISAVGSLTNIPRYDVLTSILK
jgi:ubiquinol-cytochrome c reductase core subunit 2